MTLEQMFQWCFEHEVSLYFRKHNHTVQVYRDADYGKDELLGTGKNVMAAIQDAIQRMRKQEVSA